MKKICILTENISTIGGVQKVVLNLANLFSEKYDVTIVCSDPNTNIDKKYLKINENVKVNIPKQLYFDKVKHPFNSALRLINRKLLGIENKYVLENIYVSKKELKPYRLFFEDNFFDVIIGVQGRKTVLLGYLDLPNTIKIGWQHSTFDAYFNTPHKYYWNQHMLFRNACINLDKYVVLTQSDEKLFSKNILPIATTISNPTGLHKEYCFNRNNRNILFVGRLENSKGIDYLSQIIEQFLTTYESDWNFIIIGDGSELSTLKDNHSKYQWKNRVRILGWKRNVSEYYKNVGMKFYLG